LFLQSILSDGRRPATLLHSSIFPIATTLESHQGKCVMCGPRFVRDWKAMCRSNWVFIALMSVYSQILTSWRIQWKISYNKWNVSIPVFVMRLCIKRTDTQMDFCCMSTPFQYWTTNERIESNSLQQSNTWTTDTQTHWTVQATSNEVPVWKFCKGSQSFHVWRILDSKLTKILTQKWKTTITNCLSSLFMSTCESNVILAAKSTNLRAVLLLGRTDTDSWICIHFILQNGGFRIK
jgi:hypothetical protein